MPASELSVCVGKSTLSECNDADRVPVSEIHLHEQWQSDALREGFDTALLKLDRPLPNQLSQLADTAAEPPVGEMVNARGWGVSGYDGDTRLFLDEMQRVKLPYYGSRSCAEQNRFTPRETLICLLKQALWISHSLRQAPVTVTVAAPYIIEDGKSAWSVSVFNWMESVWGGPWVATHESPAIEVGLINALPIRKGGIREII